MKRAKTKTDRFSVVERSPIPLPLLRATLLKAEKVTHDELADRVAAKFGKPRLSRATISAVLAGAFRNEEVIEVFCEITSTSAEEMFPAKEEANAAAS
jgi:hypothetical protein